jgi:DNA-binding winged helix-turn-helix (wHTH) protein
VETRESSTQRWRFGIFVVDGQRSELRRGGTPVKLREQSFRILVLLLDRAGDIVTREELRQALWPSDTWVDFDHSLNTAIMKLRDVLGDSADKPLYIETIPKRGYRFVAPVSQAGDPGTQPPKTDSSPVAPLTTVPVEQPRRRHLVPYTIAALCLLLAAIGATVFLRSHGLARPPDSNQPAQPLRIIPITTAAGNAIPLSSRRTRETSPSSGMVRSASTTTCMYS